MLREQASQFVAFVVDDTLNGRELGADPHAIVRPDSVLVGWQCGFEPLVVAVHSYLNVQISEEEAIELSKDYLTERGWFSGSDREPDFVIPGISP